MSEQTVMTPSAVARSFMSCLLRETPNVDADEFFYFQYPSPSILNEMNGDGDLFEVFDINTDFMEIDTIRGKFKTNPETRVYYAVPGNVLRILTSQSARGTAYSISYRGTDNLTMFKPNQADLERFAAVLAEKFPSKIDTCVLVQRVFDGIDETDRNLFDTFIDQLKKILSERFTVLVEPITHKGWD